MNKTIEHYASLPYTIELRNTSGEGWFARVKELSGCMSQGATAEETIANIREAMHLWLEVSLEQGDAIPEPRAEEEYSGKFVIRLPRSLHRALAETANQEGVSLNQYISTALAQSVGALRTGQASAGEEALARQTARLERLVDELTTGLRTSELGVGSEPGQRGGKHATVLYEGSMPYDAASGAPAR